MKPDGLINSISYFPLLPITFTYTPASLYNPLLDGYSPTIQDLLMEVALREQFFGIKLDANSKQGRLVASFNYVKNLKVSININQSIHLLLPFALFILC